METKTSILNASEQKRLRRYYYCTKLAGAALGASLISGFYMLFLVFVDDVFLGNETPYVLGFCVGIGMMLLFVIAFLFMLLASRFGMAGKKYEAILKKVEAHQKKLDDEYFAAGLGGQMAGGLIESTSDSEGGKKVGKAIEAISSAFLLFLSLKLLRGMSEDVAEVMRSAGMEIPRTKKFSTGIIVSSILIVLIVFIPELVDTCQTNRRNEAACSATWHSLDDYFRARDIRVSGYPPEDNRGFQPRLSVYPYDEVGDKDSCISINVSDSGRIESVDYYVYLDENKEKEENVRKMKDMLPDMCQTVSQAVQAGNLSVTDPRLFEVEDDLLDEFIQQFNARSYYDGPFDAHKIDAYADYYVNISIWTYKENEDDENHTLSICYYTSCLNPRTED